MTYGQPSSVPRWRLKSQLLLALEASRQLGWEMLGRYQTQKILYLGEVLAPLRGILADTTVFTYDKNGPYTGQIQGTLDHLVALGLVDMSNYTIVSRHNRERAKYGITADGTEMVSTLTSSHSRHRLQLSWFRSILSAVEIHGLANILAIVYQEPTFKTLRLKHSVGTPIPLAGESNETLALVSMAETAIRTVHGRVAQSDEVLCLYFQYLVALADQEASEEEPVVN